MPRRTFLGYKQTLSRLEVFAHACACAPVYVCVCAVLPVRFISRVIGPCSRNGRGMYAMDGWCVRFSGRCVASAEKSRRTERERDKLALEVEALREAQDGHEEQQHALAALRQRNDNLQRELNSVKKVCVCGVRARLCVCVSVFDLLLMSRSTLRALNGPCTVVSPQKRPFQERTVSWTR